jgi:hypoxanthine phosphoribosyltransferase
MPNNVRQGQVIHQVTWEALTEGTMQISQWIEETIGDKVSIYGIPRGGMIPAIMVVHQLEARGIQARFAADLNHLMPSELHKLVIIDEICDSGDTFKVVKQLFPFANTATVFRRHDATFEPNFVAQPVVPGKWLEFPWEIN